MPQGPTHGRLGPVLVGVLIAVGVLVSGLGRAPGGTVPDAVSIPEVVVLPGPAPVPSVTASVPVSLPPGPGSVDVAGTAALPDGVRVARVHVFLEHPDCSGCPDRKSVV